MIRIDENTGKVPSEQLMSEMGNLIDVATKDGTLITTAGLRPTVRGFGHRPVRRNPHRAARRPRFGDFTGPEAVKSPPASAAAAVRGFHRP
jgi:hypothetical protein